MTPDNTAPTREVGTTQPNLSWNGWMGRTGASSIPTWDALMDDHERVPELTGTRAIDAYDWMMTDAQVAAVNAAVVLPLMRYDWVLRPVPGVSDEAMQKLSQDLGLPIEGEEQTAGRADGGSFSFYEHLRAALRSLRYGYMPFEQVGRIDSDGWFRYTKLAERPPRTIEQINVAGDGGLIDVVQSGVGEGTRIPVDRLLMYAWEREGGSWTGRSMFRPMYRHVLIKDRLLRIDGLKHERNGMGIPVAWAPPNATTEVMLALNEITAAMKAGEESGMAMPPGSDIRLMGVQGTLPDTIASVEYHDRAISKAGLAMFLELGSTATGSRALGNTFVDFFGTAMDYVAWHICRTFTLHAIRDWVRWNLGDDAAYPLLIAKRTGDPDMPVQDIRALIEVGAITVDQELEQDLRRRGNLRPKVEQEDEAPSGAPFGYDLDGGIIVLDERRAQLGLGPHPSGLGHLTVMEFQARVAASITPSDGTPTPEEETAAEGVPAPVAASRRLSRWSRALATLPTRVRAAKRAPEYDAGMFPEGLRRQPYDHEVKAATDFKALDAMWDDATGKLVKQWVTKIRPTQAAELAIQIEAAGGDLSKLAALTAPDAGGAALLRSAMGDMAVASAAMMADEAKRQGVTLPAVTDSELRERIADRADAIAATMASDLASGASKHALRLTAAGSPLTPAQVASQVAEGMASLTDAYPNQRLGDALTASQNEGRFAAAGEARVASRWYASELLDANTCGPCRDVDGKEYGSAEEAMADYPTGGYHDCDGQERCRGTIVVVYDESAPTVEGEVDEA